MFKSYMYICEDQSTYEVSSIEHLVEQMQKSNADVFESIVAHCRNGIEVHIHKYYGVDHDVLYQESLIELYQAVMNYDCALCDSFKHYYFYRLKFKLLNTVKALQKDKHRHQLSLNSTIDETSRSLEEEIQDFNTMTPACASELNALLEQMTPVVLQLSPLEARVLEYLKEQRTVKVMAALEQETEKVIYNCISRIKVKVKSHIIDVS